MDTNTFHRQRRMFCITQGEVMVAPENDDRSHFDWFSDEGWLPPDQIEWFMGHTVRGFFDPQENALYIYVGFDFTFTNETIITFQENLPGLMNQLPVNSTTKIFFGPKDSPMFGHQMSQLYLGKLIHFLAFEVPQ